MLLLLLLLLMLLLLMLLPVLLLLLWSHKFVVLPVDKIALLPAACLHQHPASSRKAQQQQQHLAGLMATLTWL